MDILTNFSRFYDRDFSVVLTTIWPATTVAPWIPKKYIVLV